MPANADGRFSKSPVVRHFTPSVAAINQWACNHCGIVITARRTSNLLHHLGTAHPEHEKTALLKEGKRRNAWNIARLLVLENLPLRLAKSKVLERTFVTLAPNFKLPSYDSVVEATTIMAEVTNESVRRIPFILPIPSVD